MHDRLSRYLQTNNILAPDSGLKSVNQKMHVSGKFYALAEVFDCVNTKILLTKLHYFGIQGATVTWCRSFLTDRKRKTEKKIIKFNPKYVLRTGEQQSMEFPRGQF
jgi:hypothetical protein